MITEQRFYNYKISAGRVAVGTDVRGWCGSQVNLRRGTVSFKSNADSDSLR